MSDVQAVAKGSMRCVLALQRLIKEARRHAVLGRDGIPLVAAIIEGEAALVALNAALDQAEMTP